MRIRNYGSVIVLCSGLFPGTTAVFAQGGSTVQLTSFGVAPNSRGSNSRTAFQKAFAQLGSAGGGTLAIPAGDYWIDFPDIVNDVDPKTTDRNTMKRTGGLAQPKFLLVPAGVVLRGVANGSGRPATRIHWKVTSVPLFGFVNASGAGAENIDFVFDGVQPHFFPWAQEDYMQALGYGTRWLGSPMDMSAVIYAIESSNLVFQNLWFESSTADNEHTFANVMALRGVGGIPTPDQGAFKQLAPGTKVPGGGMQSCASNNQVRNIHMQDFVMGIVAQGQCNLVIQNVDADYRGSWYQSVDPTHETGSQIKNIGPPGHVIYITFQDAFDVIAAPDNAAIQRKIYHGSTRNSNITIENIQEGGHTLSNVNSLGTFALKNIQGGTIRNVVSNHPAGLIQTLVDVHNLTISNLKWSSSQDLCQQPTHIGNCGLAVIGFEPGSPDMPDQAINSEVHFSDVTLESTVAPAAIRISQENNSQPLSQNITFDGLTISCPPYRGQGNWYNPAILMLRADGAKFSNVAYTPASGGEGGNVVKAADIQARSNNVSVNIEIQGGAPADVSRCQVDQPTSGSSCHVSRK